MIDLSRGWIYDDFGPFFHENQRNFPKKVQYTLFEYKYRPCRALFYENNKYYNFIIKNYEYD